MNRTFRALLLALFLAAIALTIFFHKLTTSDVPLSPNQAYRSWYVEAKLSLNSDKLSLASEEVNSTTIKLYLPQESQRYKIVDEDFTDGKFNRQVKTLENSPNRVAVFTRQDDANNKFIFYRAIIRRKDNATPGSEEVPISGRRLVDQEFVKFGQNTARVEDNLKENLPTAEINALLNEAKKQSSDRLSLAKQIYQLSLRTDDIRVQAIRRNLRNQKSTPELAAFLLTQGNIPARVGNGILLRSKEVYSTDFIQWLEIQEGDRWLAFDPIDYSFREQNRYLTWWYGSDRVLQAKGVKNRYIENHPETGHRLRDRQIPHWQTILNMAAKLGDKTEFGYLGVDIVLDQQKGPLLLEINARPGLAIQIANQQGLIGRLKAIDYALPKLSGIQEKIAFAQEAFAVEASSINVLSDLRK